MKKYLLLSALVFITGCINAQQVTVSIDASDESQPISPYIYGKNNSLYDGFGWPQSGQLTQQQWQRLKDMGVRFFRENGGNNATKYNWRRKLSSHPDWYNNVYPHDWSNAARSLQQNIPYAQGMWAFQLAGKSARTNGANFNETADPSRDATRQNLAGGGQINPAGGGKALVEGNPDLYLENWPADSTVKILDNWFGENGANLDSTKIRYWSMDNEPEIWSGTHDDIYPAQPSPEQFMQLYFETAKKARAKFPGIKLTGPVVANEWQWYCWSSELISYKGNKYPWLEYFILRVAEEQQASGIRLLDVLDIHYYPEEIIPSQIVQLHRIYFDTNYVYPGANGIKKTGASGWDNSLTKEYIFKRCNDWLAKYIGPDHGVTLGVTETSLKFRDNPDLNAVWYASTLGEFARHQVEIFTPWDWHNGMSEVMHLFTWYGKDKILPSQSSNENYVSAYPTINTAGDSITILLVNRNLSQPLEVKIDMENFNIQDGIYELYTINDLPASETFNSHTSNALKKTNAELRFDRVVVTLPPLSVSALVLKKYVNEYTQNLEKDLIDPDASKETRSLFEFLQNQYGENIISGQTHDYYNDLKNLAGKSPLLRAGDFKNFTQGYPYLWVNGVGHTYGYDAHDQTVNSLISWYNDTDKKGIVSMHWHWHDPLGDSTSNVNSNTFYTDTTEFDIRRAVIPGTLEYECVIRDIDSIATQLKKFQAAGIPVLWRPLHEAGGGWFWWGAHGAEPCLALWDILIERLKNYHKLHNLIWVWSSPEPDWYPGNDKVDMIGYDSYPGSFVYANQKSNFDALYSITEGKKLIAMTENGPIPDPAACLDQGAPWSYFMSWSNLVTAQNSESHIKDVYGNNRVLKLESYIYAPEYNVTIKLQHNQTKKPLSATTIIFGGESKITDDKGEVQFKIREGEYSWSVSKTSYQSVTGSVTINKDSVFTISLVQTQANLRIRLVEGETPISSASVIVGSFTKTSNSLGEVVYYNLPVPSEYDYSVKIYGYQAKTGTISLICDSIFVVAMSKNTTTGITDKQSEEFGIWPNPAGSKLNFTIPEHLVGADFYIYNLAGTVVKTDRIKNALVSSDISDLKPGFYILRCVSDDGVYESNFIKN